MQLRGLPPLNRDLSNIGVDRAINAATSEELSEKSNVPKKGSKKVFASFDQKLAKRFNAPNNSMFWFCKGCRMTFEDDEESITKVDEIVQTEHWDGELLSQGCSIGECTVKSGNLNLPESREKWYEVLEHRVTNEDSVGGAKILEKDLNEKPFISDRPSVALGGNARDIKHITNGRGIRTSRSAEASSGKPFISQKFGMSGITTEELGLNEISIAERDINGLPTEELDVNEGLEEACHYSEIKRIDLSEKTIGEIAVSKVFNESTVQREEKFLNGKEKYQKCSFCARKYRETLEEPLLRCRTREENIGSGLVIERPFRVTIVRAKFPSYGQNFGTRPGPNSRRPTGACTESTNKPTEQDEETPKRKKNKKWNIARLTPKKSDKCEVI